MSGAHTVTIRHRRPDDVPALVEVLAEQQAASGYPHRWPLPYPAADFVVRARERAAWVALDGDDVVGHVCVRSAPDATGPDGTATDPLVRLWSEAHGAPLDRLGVVSAPFTATAVRGQGVGGALLDTAVAWIRAAGLHPCLDVVPGPSPAQQVYERRGWRVVGQTRPAWLGDHPEPVRVMILP